MANAAAAQTPINMAMSTGREGFSQVTPVVCTFDTLATDLTVFTPSISTNYGAIIGIVYEAAAAHNLILTVGSTQYVNLARTTFEGMGMPVGSSGFVLIGGKGQALKIQCVTALTPSILVYCVEFPSLIFNR